MVSAANHVNTRVACIKFTHEGDDVHLRVCRGAKDLRTFFDETILSSQGKPLRRLYILEEYGPEIQELLSTKAGIDPQVFFRHAKIAIFESSKKNAGNTSALPSLQDPNSTFVLEYCQLMYLNLEKQDFTLRCVESERHIASSRNKGDFDGIGVVSRKVSFWSKLREDDGWDGVYREYPR